MPLRSEGKKGKISTTDANQTVNRFSIAAAEFLSERLEPEFAQDSASLVFIAGPPLDLELANQWALNAKNSQMDLIYMTFEPGRERFGPTSYAVFAERWGAVFRWTDCELWAPKDDRPCLLMRRASTCASPTTERRSSRTRRAR